MMACVGNFLTQKVLMRWNLILFYSRKKESERKKEEDE